MGLLLQLETWQRMSSTSWNSPPRKLVSYLSLTWNTEVCVSPVNLHLGLVKSMLAENVILAAQNCSAQGHGAFTGEVSADQLADFGIQWTILGHSERRTLYGDTNEILAKKLKYTLDKGLSVIFCIGEKLDERESNRTTEVLKEQLDAVKASVSDWSKVVIAYEPVWAIGTGKVASPEQAQEAHAFIRQWFRDSVSEDVAKSIRLIYGGSVTEQNCGELIMQADVDGFLVGGASLKPAFGDIVRIVNTSG